ncbi:MAG: class I SAM-dependent methyltransferase [Acidimicrobiales bacterium]
MPDAAYDTIGEGYAGARRPDARVAAQINAGLGDAASVLNVGAGTGNYEPVGRTVAAIDPSATMLAQRPAGAAPAVQGVAESLPFVDDVFDAALSTFTLHHWDDLGAGLAELARVSARQVILLCEPIGDQPLWLLDYFPEAVQLETEQRAPTAAQVGHHLAVERVTPVLVPRDCTDGFTGAYWNRPHAYLDPAVRAGMSMLSLLPSHVLERGIAELDDDLRSGAWDERYGELRSMDTFDVGYRLVVASGSVSH